MSNDGLKLQTHHIQYDTHPLGEWTVDLPWFLHRPMNIMTKWKATPDRYRILINFTHAVMHEVNRMRRELDQESD